MTESVPSFVSHLLELRKRVSIALISYCVIAAPLIIWARQVFEHLTEILFYWVPNQHQLIATEITSPFMGPLKLALFLSLMLATPIFLYQVWAFIMPGLYPHEKRPVRVLFFLSLILFYAGALFAYFLVCPLAIQFFVYMAPANVQVMTDIQHYLSFLSKMVYSFGLGFQVPIVVCLALMHDLVSEKSLKKKRPFVIVAAFVIGMLLTPPDVVSQILLAVPLLGLFELGILLARILRPKKVQQDLTTESPT